MTPTPNTHPLPPHSRRNTARATPSSFFGLWIPLLVVTSLVMAGPAWSQCDVQSPDPDCPERPVVLLQDALLSNPNGAAFACARDDDFCIGLLLANQEGVSSQVLFVEGQPQGAIGTHAYVQIVDAPGVLCACPGKDGDQQDACARACLVGFAIGKPHESQRASCKACGRLLLAANAREDVAVDDDGDPNTPPVLEPLAYMIIGETNLIRATGTLGQECRSTMILDEIGPPFNFTFTFENNNHGIVVGGCL